MVNRPIAVFDSGAGGLTVLRRAWELYPGEHFIYGADSQHFPYGSRSLDEVKALFLRFLDFFMTQDIKAVIVACNTATAAALETAQRLCPVPVIGVVYPGAEKAVKTTANGRIGVLSTYATYKSGIYRRAIAHYDHRAEVVQWPCPVLVTMAELGNIETYQARLAVRECLNMIFPQNVDTVVLGCTHFPHMERIFYEEVGERARIIDPGYETAKHLPEVIGPLLSGPGGSIQFYTSGNPRDFNRNSSSLWPNLAIASKSITWTPDGYELSL